MANLLSSHKSAEYWDSRLAESWDRWTWPTKNGIIAKRTPISDSILDIACGNGSTTRELHARGVDNLAGLEISEHAMRRVRQEGITMYQGNLPRLPPHDSTYDAIIVSQVLEHIIRRDLFTREISRNLAKSREFLSPIAKFSSLYPMIVLGLSTKLNISSNTMSTPSKGFCAATSM